MPGNPASLKKRKDMGDIGRFRRFTREWIADRGDSLDIAWIKDDSDGETKTKGSGVFYGHTFRALSSSATGGDFVTHQGSK